MPTDDHLPGPLRTGIKTHAAMAEAVWSALADAGYDRAFAAADRAAWLAANGIPHPGPPPGAASSFAVEVALRRGSDDADR